jgi:predicted nucleotidyltransferase
VTTVLLSGIVGSTAYGLAGPDSDVDRLGIFAAPTLAFHGLRPPADSHVTTSPDVTMHEAAKAARLILKANPTVLEILWLPPVLYEVRTPLGEELIAIRSSLLSAWRVRAAFLGYATSQFRRLTDRGDGSFSADTRNRTAKHSRHLMRLVESCIQLYTTGELDVRLTDPQRFIDFGEQVAAGDLDIARKAIADAEDRINRASTPLPDEPDEAAAERWLLNVRATLLAQPDYAEAAR